MIRKGKISAIDLVGKSASVVFQDLDSTVTSVIPILTLPIKDADFDFVVDGVQSQGKITIDYTPAYMVGDIVTVAFFTDNFSNGVIIGKVGGV
jgi:hypothetical protein